MAHICNLDHGMPRGRCHPLAMAMGRHTAPLWCRWFTCTPLVLKSDRRMAIGHWSALPQNLRHSARCRSLRACVHACTHAWVRACVLACMLACVLACVHACLSLGFAECRFEDASQVCVRYDVAQLVARTPDEWHVREPDISHAQREGHRVECRNLKSTC